MESFESYAEARDWLYGLRNQGSKYGIERMKRFASALGNPENNYPVIHVAGTNGKGSVCAMLERVYRESGLKTGLFCSPHLVHQGERIKVGGVPMTEEELLSTTNTLLPIAAEISSQDRENHPTFFEWMTGIAFLHLNIHRVDIAIFETGLGGRLDSTNVISPKTSVITSIGWDHVEILGDSLEKIAAEKGGIIKPGQPVVIGKMEEAPKKVLREIAEANGSPLFAVEDHFQEETLPKTNLSGSIQRWNAATAKLVCQILRNDIPITHETIQKGLNSVELLGRWSETIVQGRSVILDGAHNEDATIALCENLERLIKIKGERPVIIVGFTGSRQRAEAFLPKIQNLASRIIKVEPSHIRGIRLDEFGPELEKGGIEEIFPNSQTCSLEPKDTPVVVTGSLYLVAEVLQRLQGTSSSDQQKLQD